MHKLKKETSSLIKSQHTFSNTFTILKELIENSLDAKSTKITISLTNDSITIQDNGSGISNFDLVGCEGCTSKTEELNNIFSAQPITSFYGFRGQALFSLSKISKLTIESNEKKKDFFTNKMLSSYLREGSIVTVSDIFYNIPVRKKLLNVKRELNQIIYLLNSYLIVNNISITLYFFDKLILSKKSPILFSKEIITEKFNICLSKEINLNNIYIFYLNKPVVDTHLKKIIHSYVKENVILIIKEKCDINTCGKNEVLIRNRDEFIKQLRNKLNELMNEECYLIPSPENKKIKNELTNQKENIVDQKEIIFNEIKLPFNFGKKEEKYFINLKNESLNLKNEFFNERNISILLSEENKENKYSIINQKNIKENNNGEVKENNEEKIKKNNEEKINESNEEIKENSEEEIKENDEEENSEKTFVFKKINISSSLEIQKNSFSQMKIIGQFNQGFILCSFLNHRVIIDQHAADEIKNYEKLKKELNLKKQYLIQPIEIKLDELDLLIINDNLELFDKNGYVVKNNKLITLPVYKGIDFLYKDFVDFVEDVKNGLELSNKLNEIIKSKACRMSIMIGQKLSHKEMCSIVYNLSLLDKPWWCPHGRPVCRVL